MGKRRSSRRRSGSCWYSWLSGWRFFHVILWCVLVLRVGEALRPGPQQLSAFDDPDGGFLQEEDDQLEFGNDWDGDFGDDLSCDGSVADPAHDFAPS